MNGKNKSRLLFILTVIALFVLVSYLGARTIRHEALLAQQRADAIVQARLMSIQDFVFNLLKQKAAHLDAFTHYIQLDTTASSTDASFKKLVATDTELDQVFILQKNKLIYPKTNQPLSQKEQLLLQDIACVLEDPSLLFAHSINSENDRPSAGWYIGSNQTGQIPVLIYWRNQGDKTIGFRVSYIKLLADVINHADFAYDNAVIRIMENDRVLYQSIDKNLSIEFSTPENESNVSAMQTLGVHYLPYPLTGWQLVYQGFPLQVLSIYLWGSAAVLLMLACMGLIIYRIYREYNHARREAVQQVSFVSQVSHELKTPLTNITLYAELLQEDLELEENPQTARSLDVIISESQRLSRLIQNILSFTRPAQIILQEVDLSELLEQIVQTFTPLFSAKHVVLQLNIENHITLKTDRDRVSQIICNFLSNAEKYAANGKRVEINLNEQADFIDINVRDYGPGIPAAEHKLIFEPFYRAQSALTEGVSGTGIGLTLAQQLATSIGAQVILRDIKPGACFTLRLKKQQKHPMQAVLEGKNK